jgi:hypothetical protein
MTAEVGDMLEHITAVCEIELAVRHGQPLTESNLIVDIETGKSGMATCRLDRHCGGIYPNHPAAAAREFFGQKAATAADVEGMQVFKSRPSRLVRTLRKHCVCSLPDDPVSECPLWDVD